MASYIHTLTNGSDQVLPRTVAKAVTMEDGTTVENALANAKGTPVVTTEGTGSAYTATVPGITSLTVGLSFILIPHTVSTSTIPTLDINGIGAKGIRRRVSTQSGQFTSGFSSPWLTANKPIHIIYDGTYWLVQDMSITAATDLSGTVAVNKGGTGQSSLTDTTYTAVRYRASALVSAETAPSVNGVVNWTYE